MLKTRGLPSGSFFAAYVGESIDTSTHYSKRFPPLFGAAPSLSKMLLEMVEDGGG